MLAVRIKFNSGPQETRRLGNLPKNDDVFDNWKIFKSKQSMVG